MGDEWNGGRKPAAASAKPAARPVRTEVAAPGHNARTSPTAEQVLSLQRSAGNAAIGSVLDRPVSGLGLPGPPRVLAAPIPDTPVVARDPLGAVVAGDVLPAPLPVVWGTDPFLISLARTASGDQLEVTIRYQGTFPFEGNPAGRADRAWRTSIRVGRQPLRPRVRESGAASVVIDIYGDASEFLRVGDKVEVDKSPAGVGRRHGLSATLTQFGGGEASSVVVRDPSAARNPPPAPAREDRPGARPQLSSVLGDYNTFEGVIDGDGDQRKELLVRISRLKPAPGAGTSRVRVVLVRIADGAELLNVVGELPVRPDDFFFAPMVLSVTDGDRPTVITLDLPKNQQRVTVAPPRPGSAPVYTVRFAGVDVTAPAAGGQGELGRVFGAGVAGGIIYNDLTLGAYEDRFRLSLQWRSGDRAMLGLSPLFRGEPNGAYGVEIPAAGVLRCQIVDITPVSVGFDLSGDGKADLRIHDTISTPVEDSMPERDRDHTVRLVGPAVGGEQVYAFPIRRGQPQPVGYQTSDSKVATSNALAVTGLNQQRRNATYAAQLDEYEMSMMKVRGEAATVGAIPKSLYTAWSDLSADMIKIRAQLATGAPQAALQAGAVRHAQLLFSALAAETASAEEHRYYQFGYGKTNPYTGEKTDHVVSMPTKTTGAGPELAGQIALGSWREAFDNYQTLVSGLDRWIAKKVKDAGGAHSKLAEQAEFLVSSRAGMAALEKYNPTRVLAVFQPNQKFSGEGGWVEQVPLNLYYYRDGDTWYLKNLTNPNKAYHYKAAAQEGQSKPPQSLFDQLNDSDRLPEGIVHYEIPGGYAGEVIVRSTLTFRKFLTYLGVGLALLGLTLATAGTGTVAVAGSWALAGSAVAGGLAATLDLIDKADHGDLTATTAIIDIAQIVASIAGVSALRYGMIAKGGMVAASEGNPLLGEAAKAAASAHRVYVISVGTRMAADMVTVITMGVEVAGQLDEIEKGPGDRTSKDRAKALLLAQLAVTGGLTALSIKGELPNLGNGHKLTLFTPKGSDVPMALVEGTAAPSSLKFSQKDIAKEINDKSMTVEQLAASMRKDGWKGDPLHVIVLDDGTYLSVDNRRLWAAHQAQLPEVPIWYHSPKEKFPKEWINDGFILRRYNIYRLPDGSYTTTKSKEATLAFSKGREPATLWEAALFRTADQGNIAEGIRFPMWGSYELPKIRGGKTSTPAGTE